MPGGSDSDDASPAPAVEHTDARDPERGECPSSGLHLKRPLSVTPARIDAERSVADARIVGARFGGRFELRRRIGAGGTGTVYEAFDRVAGELVALKALQNADVASIYAIKEEFRALSGVVAPNLVRLRELFSDGDRWFFTMDLVRGAHFIDHVRADAAGRGAGLLFDAEVLRELMRQLVCGVGAIHAADRLHRDLKPSNVMVDSGERVVVLDFGLVCAPANQDPDGIAGTPLYMAPEQLSGLGTKRASDWYSVGVILFEALTGQIPFGGLEARALMQRLSRDGPSPSSLVPGVPADLDALCVALLARDPARRPTYEAVRSALGLNAESPNSSVPTRTQTGAHFIGRQRELANLAESFELLDAGKPVVVLLDGDPGVGKSTLVQRFLSECSAKTPKQVFAGRCFEHEMVPYKGVDNLIDELGLHLAALDDDLAEPLVESDMTELLRAFPVLRSTRAIARRALAPPTLDAQEARHRAFRALKELIRNFASTRTVVFFVDDLQWADLDSVRLLSELLSPPAPPPVLFIAAYRTEGRAADSAVSAFRAHAAIAQDAVALREISLSPLQPHESQELALTLADGGGAPSVTDAIVAEAAGNPLFIELLSRDGRAAASKTGRRLSLERLIVDQLAEESAAARRLMSLVAAAGEPIPQEIVLGALPGGGAARTALAALRVRRFVRTFQSGGHHFVEPYHDRIRESVYASFTEPTRQEHHLELATLLESAGGSEPDLLARQFHRAGHLEKAHRYAVRAGEVAASALAFVRAAEHYAVAIETTADSDVLASLHRRRADALASSGRCAAAATAYLRGAEFVAGDAALDLRARAAAVSFTAGHVEEALRTLSPLLEQTGVAYPKSSLGVGVHLASALARLRIRGVGFRLRPEADIPPRVLRRIDAARAVADGLISVDPMRAASILLRTAALALDAGEPGRIAWALSHYGLFLSATGVERWAPESLRLIDRADALARDADSGDGAAVVLLSRAKLSISLGQWRTALTQADECAAYARRECVGGWGHVTVANNTSLFALQAIGEIKTMAARADEHLKEAVDTGDLYAEVTTHIYGGVGRLFADDPGGARQRVEGAVARWRKPHEFTFQNWFGLQALTQCDLYEGRPFDAWDRLAHAWPLMERSRLLHLWAVRPFALRLRANTAAACALARPSESHSFVQLATREVGRLEAMGRADPVAASRACRASLLAGKGRKQEAAHELSLAAAAFMEANMPLESMCAREAQGVFMGEGTHGALRSSAAEELRARGVSNPARWASRIVVPHGEGEE